MVRPMLDPTRHEVARFSIEDLKELMDDLPPPTAVYKIEDVFFDIYKIKDLLSYKFHSEALRNLLIDARGSYYVYGPRPPFDEYDSKALIYLVRAYKSIGDDFSYPIKEEWLSVRMVPPHGDPSGCGEIDMFVTNDGSVGDLIRKKLFFGRSNYMFGLASSSRLCGLGPFLNWGSRIELGDWGRQYTALCYFLIREQYLIELSRLRLNYQYLTGIIHNSLADKSLSVEVGGEKRVIGFTPAYAILGLSNPESVRLDRGRPDLYAYRYPRYWFNSHQLIDCVKGLIECKKLNSEVLRCDNARNLGNILTINGVIEGSNMTGEELRVIIDKMVRDGPELKITPMIEVKRSLKWLRSVRKKP